MVIDRLYIISNYFYAAILFLVALWIATSFETADFGELSFFRLSIQYLQYTEIGLLQYVFRSLSAEEKIDRSDINKIVSYLLISIFSGFTFYVILGNQFSFFTDSSYLFILIFCIINGLFSKHTIDRLRIEGKIRTIVYLEGIANLLLLIGVAVSILIFENNLLIILISYGFYQIPFTLYFLFFLYEDLSFKLDFRLNKELLYESIMLVLFGLGSLFYFSIDRLIIKFNWGFEDLGLYAFPLTVVTGGFIVMQSILWINMPNFISSIKNSTDSVKTNSNSKFIQKN